MSFGLYAPLTRSEASAAADQMRRAGSRADLGVPDTWVAPDRFADIPPPRACRVVRSVADPAWGATVVRAWFIDGAGPLRAGSARRPGPDIAIPNPHAFPAGETPGLSRARAVITACEHHWRRLRGAGVPSARLRLLRWVGDIRPQAPLDMGRSATVYLDHRTARRHGDGCTDILERLMPVCADGVTLALEGVPAPRLRAAVARLSQAFPGRLRLACRVAADDLAPLLRERSWLVLPAPRHWFALAATAARGMGVGVVAWRVDPLPQILTNDEDGVLVPTILRATPSGAVEAAFDAGRFAAAACAACASDKAAGRMRAAWREDRMPARRAFDAEIKAVAGF